VLNDRQCGIDPQTVLFLPPKQQHGIVNIDKQGLKTLDVKFRIRSRKLMVLCKQLPCIISNAGVEIYDQLESIRENGITKDILYEENCRLLFSLILVKLLRMTHEIKKETLPEEEIAPNREMSPLTGKILDYIKIHYQDSLNSKLLEEKLNYSYRYLSKFFHRETNMTPVQFIERYKISKAKEFLRDTDMEIKNISETLGFSDVHQFSRSFKKTAGIPPAQWRETAWLGICKDVVIHSGFENTLFINKLNDPRALPKNPM
jgi:AraC-like DNA-binding protein